MFPEYPKINSVFERDDRGRFIEGHWATEEIDYLANRPWYWTEKIDGTNFRIGLEGESRRFRLGGRADNTQIPVHLLDAIRDAEIEARMRAVFPEGDVILFGEGCGPKIQKHGERYGAAPKVVLFDVIVDGWWLHQIDVENVAKKLELEHAPVMGVWDLGWAIQKVKEGSLKSRWGDFEPEGIVGRPGVMLFDRKGARIMTKIKARDFKRS